MYTVSSKRKRRKEVEGLVEVEGEVEVEDGVIKVRNYEEDEEEEEEMQQEALDMVDMDMELDRDSSASVLRSWTCLSGRRGFRRSLTWRETHWRTEWMNWSRI